MSKAKDFIKEAGENLTDVIVTLQVKMRVKDVGKITPKDAEKLAQAALTKAIPEEDLRNGKIYVISIESTGSKLVKI